MDYDKWKEGFYSPNSLLLDPKNPRIPPREKEYSQDELLTELVKHDDVFKLAKSIVDYGFFPGESLIAIELKRKKYILEGNRRLAACKLLHNPENAPYGYVTKFRNLSNRFSISSINKLRTTIAPNRSAATQILVTRHTEYTIQRWKTPMQAKFYYNLLTENGISLEDLAQSLNLNPSNLQKEIALHKMYSVACSFEYPENIDEIVKNPRRFSLTTLQRVYQSNPGKGFFHISIDDEGEIQGHIHPDEFRKGLKKVVEDIATGEETSRTLNSDPQIKKYLDGIDSTYRPNPKKDGAFTSETFLSPSSKPPKKINKPKKKAPKKRSNPTGLISRKIKCTVENERINSIVNELYAVSPARFSNATAYLLRGLIEMSMRYHLSQLGEIGLMKSEYREKLRRKNKTQRIPRNWMPGLEEMVKRFVNNEVLENAAVTKSLNRSMNDHEGLFKMNLFAHNEAYHPNEEKLRNIWKDLEEFMKIMLTEPEID